MWGEEKDERGRRGEEEEEEEEIEKKICLVGHFVPHHKLIFILNKFQSI